MSQFNKYIKIIQEDRIYYNKNIEFYNEGIIDTIKEKIKNALNFDETTQLKILYGKAATALIVGALSFISLGYNVYDVAKGAQTDEILEIMERHPQVYDSINFEIPLGFFHGKTPEQIQYFFGINRFLNKGGKKISKTLVKNIISFLEEKGLQKATLHRSYTFNLPEKDFENEEIKKLSGQSKEILEELRYGGEPITSIQNVEKVMSKKGDEGSGIEDKIKKLNEINYQLLELEKEYDVPQIGYSKYTNR